MGRDGRRLRVRKLVAAAIALLCAGVLHSRAGAAAPTYTQDQIEAAFLYRFAGFVSWPRGALQAPTFTIAVLDDDAVASDLARMLADKELQGRPARVRRITRISQLGDAQILYVGDSDAHALKHWLAPLAGRPVLLVTSQAGGLDDGSAINFLIVDRHVRFDISLAAARRSGLTISADLLSVAAHIEGGPVGSQAPCQTQPRPLQELACAPRLATR